MSAMYAEALNSTTSSVTLQITARPHGIKSRPVPCNVSRRSYRASKLMAQARAYGCRHAMDVVQRDIPLAIVCFLPCAFSA